jgi:23S rRNA G2445 N2-methylase RlmL
MADFFASCPYEVSGILHDELKELGMDKLEKTKSGVYFSSSWEGCYKVNLHSRIASRVYKPVLEFIAYDKDQLYNEIQKHDFTKYISPEQTVAIDVKLKECKMHDQRFVAMRIKDAVVDQFTAAFGKRPDVESKNPDLRIHVKATKNNFWVALDTSGSSLYQRGYRKEVGEAPLKENLAAGLITLTGWDRKSPLVDPMCGSGTFLIEAAMMYMNMAPGTLRKKFGFQNWKNYKKDVWEKLVNEAMDKELPAPEETMFFGYDLDNQMIKKAKINAHHAGVENLIKFRKETLSLLKPEVEKGMLITNPPYGARIGEEDWLKDVYRDLGYCLKHSFKGWDCWILSGNKDLILEMKLKADRRIMIFNGPIECRFLKYSMF